MPSLVLEVLLGIYIGLMTGIVPGIVAGTLGFLFKYMTGVTLPGLGVVILAVAIAGVSGGLLGLVDPSISQSPRLLVALIVVMMISLYTHAQGDKLGAELPRRFSLRALGARTLAPEAIFHAGGIGRVRVEVLGEVASMDGYPALSPELRTELSSATWEFPADLPLDELERRLEDRLVREYALAEVAVDMDDRARARVTAAPPLGSLSRRVPSDRRAVSIAALVPTGLSVGEHIEVILPDETITGRLVSARSDPNLGPLATDGGTEPVEQTSAPRTTGGEGRVTVAVKPRKVRPLMAAERGRIVALPRGTGLEFEAIEHLTGAGHSFATIELQATSAGETLASFLGDTGVRVLAIDPDMSGSSTDGAEWEARPPLDRSLAAGDELLVVGPTENVETVIDSQR